ncbi:uncharacterized protein LOC119661799 [Teleopsis dalmanni]|uniref:uncharacterized protein LOC119661799 n=1 Tax=Teleopsis dalmanni TaxID=139649 RepID=UPI0018CEBAAA|nr:uncharacterized protein LOC119661799 [Teleopsis dalmanni]
MPKARNAIKEKNAVSRANPETKVQKHDDHVVESNDFQSMSSPPSDNSDTDNGHKDCSSFDNNELYKLRGQNWSQFFNLIKDDVDTINKLHENAKQDLEKPSTSLKSVIPLDSNDMPDYGLHPKTTTLEMVVCNYCSGVYKLSGFKNHVNLRHPEIWVKISKKTMRLEQACKKSKKPK